MKLFEGIELNKIFKAKLGRFGVLAINKPIDCTSHDVVDKVRKALKIRKVGHGGALDPFADGVLMILVGKATKLSGKFLNMDKGYKTEICLGIQTSTLDPEGEIISVRETTLIKEGVIKSTLKSLVGRYKQQVPLYSSVKVEGNKLRVLARKANNIELKGDSVTFKFSDGIEKNLIIPSKLVEIYDIEFKNLSYKSYDELNLRKIDIAEFGIVQNYKFPVIELTLKCSKGFYVRQFALELANKIQPGYGGSLISLTRTNVGLVELADCIELDDLSKL